MENPNVVALKIQFLRILRSWETQATWSCILMKPMFIHRILWLKYGSSKALNLTYPAGSDKGFVYRTKLVYDTILSTVTTIKKWILIILWSAFRIKSFQIYQRNPRWFLITRPTIMSKWMNARHNQREKLTCKPGFSAIPSSSATLCLKQNC